MTIKNHILNTLALIRVPASQANCHARHDKAPRLHDKAPSRHDKAPRRYASSGLIVAGLCLLTLTFPIFANASPDLKRSFVLSSGYAERVFNSNEELVRFPLSVMQLWSLAPDAVNDVFDNSLASRISVGILEVPFSYWLTYALLVPFHEFGHARAFAAMDQGYFYTSSGIANAETSSFWLLSLIRLGTPPALVPGAGGAATVPIGNQFVFSRSLWEWIGGDPGLSAIIAGAGLNNQMLLGKKIAATVQEKNGHVTYLQHYVINKAYAALYASADEISIANGRPREGSDIAILLDAYAAKGYNISISDIKLNSLLSLASGTTFSFLRGYYNYFVHGSPVVEPAEVYGVRIPDINSYINSRGLSLEFVSGYRVAEWLRFDVAYEVVTRGDSTNQLTVAGHYDLAHSAPVLRRLRMSPEIVCELHGAFGGSLELEWGPYTQKSSAVLENISAYVRGALLNGRTLYGERNMPSMINRNVAFDFGFGIAYNY